MLVDDSASTRLRPTATVRLGDDAESRVIANRIGRARQFTSPLNAQQSGMSCVQSPLSVVYDATRKVSRCLAFLGIGPRQTESAKTAVELFLRVGLQSRLASTSQDVRFAAGWSVSPIEIGRFARMRSRTGNSLSTLMFLVPLLGVPLMAIFGVPQFVPVIASSVSEEATRPSGLRAYKQGVGESAAASSIVADPAQKDFTLQGEQQLPDVFAAPSRPRRDSRPVRGLSSHARGTDFVETSLSAETPLTHGTSTVPVAETAERLNDLFGNPAARANPAELRSRERSNMTTSRGELSATIPKTARSTTAHELSGDGLTWREAVRRLNELGIQEFRLEPGNQLREFYFACEFTPHRNARVMRRFEAEAAEPLLAVKAVLRQIDDWLTRR